ncbi:hypothetical protein PG987_004813 [Apiospora arundinis]
MPRTCYCMRPKRNQRVSCPCPSVRNTDSHQWRLDVAQVATHVLTCRGEHGFDDRHRGQMMVVAGPMLCAGAELATAASEALGSEMKFESISKSEAKKMLNSQSESDQSELEYLLEYYSLVREGKTNYISTTAFVNVTGSHSTEPVDFFKMYRREMEPVAKRAKRAHKFTKAVACAPEAGLLLCPATRTREPLREVRHPSKRTKLLSEESQHVSRETVGNSQ